MLNRYRERLAKIRADGLYRRPIVTVPKTGLLDFSTNDYLNLTCHPEVRSAAAAAAMHYGTGATAARLMSGTLPCHEQLEEELARFCGTEASLLFGCGFLANAGIIPALADKESFVFADRLVHASIIEGIRLSGATFKRFHHNDPEHLEKLLSEVPPDALKLVITESVFSMDGDLALLPEILLIAKKHKALTYIDEAHALGIYGEHGGGLCTTLPTSLRPDIVIATLGKSLGSFGGFCACSVELREYLINTVRTFIFSTSLPPSEVFAARQALRICSKNTLGTELLNRSILFHKALGLPGDCLSQIIPLPVGDNQKALDLAEVLAGEGLKVTAIRPPTVPPGTARLRLSVTLAHTPEELLRAAEIINRIRKGAV